VPRAPQAEFTSMFDLYRTQLANGLGLAIPKTLEEERTMWREFARFMFYRRAFSADFLDQYRALVGGRISYTRRSGS
jgi:hypothetical protein